MTHKGPAFLRRVSGAWLFFGVAAGCGGSTTSPPPGSGGSAGSAGTSSAGAAGTTAQGGTPNAGAPNAGAPNAGAPNAGAPNAGAPNAGAPNAGAPNAGAPNAGAPNAGAPNAGGSGGGMGGDCNPACGLSRVCCAGQCVNVQNDPHNCGGCGVVCTAGTYCGAGSCAKPACDASCTGDTCCGTECCTPDKICCDPQGPVSNGPHCVTPSASGTCPPGCAPACVCASPDTPIATPDGERAIATLRVGDLVYSVEGGAVKAVPIIRVKQTAVRNHHVMRVKLATGATLEISGGHPTSDGRSFADLHTGSLLDGVPVISVEKVAYSYPSTFDILPASSSESYFAAGALIGSTIDRAQPGGPEPTCTGAP